MRFFRHLILSMLFCSYSLFAEADLFGGTPSFETDDTIAWSTGDGAFDMPCGFFGLFLDYENIFHARVKDRPISYNEVGFSELDVEASYTRLLYRKHALGFGFGWTGTTLDWDNNPYFNQREFDTFNLSLNGLYTASKSFQVKGGVSMSVDTDEWDLSSYTFYNLTTWARWAFCFDPVGEVGLNGGVTVRTGLKDDLIYPIFGVDFFLNERVQVNLIFPIDMYVRYLIDENWRVEIGGKIWNSRHRLKADAKLAKGYFQYENAGIELGVTYEWRPIAEFNLHVGSTLGNGDIQVSNSDNRAVQQYDLGASLYIGGAAEVRF